MSRADAKQSFTVSEFKKQMAEVYHHLGEQSPPWTNAPWPTRACRIFWTTSAPQRRWSKIIRPIYNFKAGDED